MISASPLPFLVRPSLISTESKMVMANTLESFEFDECDELDEEDSVNLDFFRLAFDRMRDRFAGFVDESEEYEE